MAILCKTTSETISSFHVSSYCSSQGTLIVSSFLLFNSYHMLRISDQIILQVPRALCGLSCSFRNGEIVYCDVCKNLHFVIGLTYHRMCDFPDIHLFLILIPCHMLKKIKFLDHVIHTQIFRSLRLNSLSFRHDRMCPFHVL